jgi:hypothetical protein
VGGIIHAGFEVGWAASFMRGSKPDGRLHSCSGSKPGGRLHSCGVHAFNAKKMWCGACDIYIVNVFISGASRNREKVWCVYMTVLNIPPAARSKLHCILIVAVASKRATRTRDQLVEFFGHIQKCISALELSGVWMKALSRKVPVRFQFVASDSLGAHQLMGMQMTFSSGHICRWCLASYTDIQVPNMRPCDPRTTENFEEYQRAARSNGPRTAAVFGVKTEPLLTLPSVDLVECYPQDPGHDIFEGEGKMLIIYVYSYMTSCCGVSFEQLRQRVSKFTCGPLDAGTTLDFVRIGVLKDVPSLIGKMDQVYRWFRFFPFLFGDLFEPGDPFFAMVKAFRSVVLMVKRFRFDRFVLQRLRNELVRYRELRTRLVKVNPADTDKKPVPDRATQSSLAYKESVFWHKYHFSVKPKFHYVVAHLAEMIEKFGLPREFDTIRFEGLHHCLLEKRRLGNNTVNVPFTMAARMQEELTLRLHSNNFLQNFLEFEETESVLMEEHRFLIENVLGDAASVAVCSNFCKIDSFKYRALRRNDLVTAVFIVRDGSVFVAIVLLIIIACSTPYLLCRVHKTDESQRFGCFALQKDSSIELFRQKDLRHPQPVHVYRHSQLSNCAVVSYDL